VYSDRTPTPFPISPTLTASASGGGDLVQSLTYRESLTPYEPPAATGARPAGALLGHAPDLLRSAAGGAWALVSISAAGSVLVVLVLVLVRVVGWLA
jgi:hypothetical protein